MAMHETHQQMPRGPQSGRRWPPGAPASGVRRTHEVSASVPKTDALDKIAGRARYIADMQVEGVLFGKLVLSTHPRARLVSVQVPELPAGFAVVDRRDVPGMNAVHMIKDNWPLFPEETVEYVGQPILLLVGPDADEVERLAGLVAIEYEELDPILRMDAPGVSSVPGGTPGGTDWSTGYTLRKGKPEAVRGGPVDIALDEALATGPQEHVYLEPQGVIAWYEKDRITVAGSMQCPFYVRTAVAGVFGWAAERVRVVQTATGGGFGGKEEYPSVLASFAAVAAHKTGRPVRLVLDRQEDLAVTTKRHASRTFLHSQVTGGVVERLQAEVDLDGGAFEGMSSTVLQRAMFSVSGVYRLDNVEVTGRALKTNTVPAGAFRGFGAPQAIFAIEMHMTHLAYARGDDPLDFKLRHVVRQGDTTITGGTFHDPIVLPEMVERAVRYSDYYAKRREFAAARDADPAATVRRGIGVSLFNHGCGFTGSGERDIIKGRVRLRRDGEGVVHIFVSSVEMGQGAETTLKKVVARTLGIPLERVVLEPSDTDSVPDSGPTVASRTAMIVGGLLQKAAQRMAAEHPDGGACEVEEVYHQPEELSWDQETFTGDAYPAFSWGVNVVEVELDMLTYEVRPTDVWAVYDVGVPLDERIVTGQMHGGIVQSLGWATMENLESRDGRYRQGSLTDYVIPAAQDVPRIHVDYVTNPYRDGAFGAKGAGELPFSGGAPALAAAVEHALGKSVHRIPLTPEYLEEVDQWS